MRRSGIAALVLSLCLITSAVLSGCSMQALAAFLGSEAAAPAENEQHEDVKLSRKEETAAEEETVVAAESMADETEETTEEAPEKGDAQDPTRVTLSHGKSYEAQKAKKASEEAAIAASKAAAEALESTEPNEEFRAYLNTFLIEQFENDTLSVNFFFTDPEAFGINMSEVGWPAFTEDPEEESTSEVLKRELEGLAAFDYDTLTHDEKIAYDCFKDYLEDELLTEDMLYYYEPLSSISGYQASVPVELSMFSLRSEQDVENYLTLLELFPEHFADLLKFEQEKSEAGLFMSDEKLDGVLEQIESFTENREESFLYGTFEARLSELGLPEDTAAAYIERNNALVPGVYEAYDALSNGLEALRGSGRYGDSLHDFPEGEAFYDYLLKSDIGTDMSAKDLWKYLEKRSQELLNEYMMLYYKNPKVADCFDKIEYPEGTPEEIMELLIEKTADDFPALDTVEYQIHIVDESLREFLNPAFYYVPPVDNDRINNIYINPDDGGELPEDIFITLAHEGYPGHLYQMNYFKQHSDIPLRQIIGNVSYEEGWAEYQELQSYALIDGISKDEAEFMRINSEYSLVLSALMDLGIHYKGWDRKEFADFAGQYFEMEEEDVEDTYIYIAENPAEYLKYAVGCLMFEDFIDRAYDEADGKLDLKAFYEKFLQIGPAPLNIVEKYLFEE